MNRIKKKKIPHLKKERTEHMEAFYYPGNKRDDEKRFVFVSLPNQDYLILLETHLQDILPFGL